MLRIGVLVSLCLIVAVFVCLVTLSLHTGSNQADIWRRIATFINTSSNATVESQSIILLWTSFFGNVNYLPSTKEKQCEFQNCVITSNRSLLNQSGLVVFHFLDTSVADLPKFRRPDQAWILFALESPQFTGPMDVYNGMFNWTATYRMDSDIWTPYDHVKKLNSSEANQVTLNNFAKGKTKLAAWFTSNCHTSGNREQYVQELQKTVSVDVYGSCGTLECSPKMSFECYHQAARQYFFYLAFENSICKDYVTEKFFHILKTDMVPVVFGGADYQAIAPPNSFIDALSFKSPQALGEYLTLVSQNETLYNSYFAWRNTHGLGGYHWVCQMCLKLQTMFGKGSGSEKSKVYNDLGSWWRKDAKCKSWTPQGLKKLD